MTYVLYSHPLSPYAQKVRILLREKGLAFEVRLPDALGSGQDTGYGAHNPRLEVPALEAEGTTLYDSTVILEYLEDKHPTPPLHAPDPLARARGRTVEEVCDTHYEAINWGLGELRFFGRGGDQADALRAAAETDTRALQGWLSGQVSRAGWLSGERFGWSDMAAAPYVTMSELFGFPPQAGTPLARWVKQVRARPSVAETVAEADASVANMTRYSGLLDSGAFQRHFRDHRLEWMVRAGGMAVVLEGLAKNNVRFTDVRKFAAP